MHWRDRNRQRLDELVPTVERKVGELLNRMESLGHPMLVTDGLRTMRRQAALYAKGRTARGPRVTNARPGFSWHNFGVAADCAFVKRPTATRYGVTWQGPWEVYGREAKKLGMVWGGTFRSLNDSPHVEWHPGVTLADARKGAKRWQDWLRWYADPTNAEGDRREADPLKIIVDDSLATQGFIRNGRVYAPVADVVRSLAPAAQIRWHGKQRKLYIYRGARRSGAPPPGDCHTGMTISETEPLEGAADAD